MSTSPKRSTQRDLIERVKNIIDNKKLNITDANFVNDDSKFIIITYWWGKGNINRNTQSPCKELNYLDYNWQLKDGQKLIREPVLFEKMIDTWEKNCKSKKCNYFAQEYPEFAFPGGYQLAINAKPLFIRKVLDTLRDIGREDISVVYIDGDMTVNKYPHIFDMYNVDYMGRGWNIDPRSNIHYKTKPCFDPFTFETSGGIMYFCNNDNGRELLNMWAKWSFMQKFQGKADDRILSMLINSKQLYLTMNILQLPIEYLWLTDAYEPLDKRDDYLNKKHYSRNYILFEHPACLTSEESARDQGAADDRQPPHYAELVENQLDCHSEGGVLYEFIVFDTNKQAREWNKYLQYMSSEDASLGKYKDGESIIPYYIRSYKSGYSEKNDFVVDNTEDIKGIIAFLKKDANINKYDLFYIIYNSNETAIYEDHIYIKNKDHMVLYIIALLSIKKMVVCLPNTLSNSGSSNKSLKYILKNKNKFEIICTINNDNFNYPIIDEGEPIFFNYTSGKLIKLLRMSENITEFNKLLKSCVLYIQLIRCYFIMKYSKTSQSSPRSPRSPRMPRMPRSLSTSQIPSLKSLYKSLTLGKKSKGSIVKSKKYKSI
jgi:hypothetical protein